MPPKALGLVALLALASPAAAQESLSDRLNRMLGDVMREVDPWLADLMDKLGDLTGWHAPEVLPNGDILIRRRQPVPESDSDSQSSPGEPFEL